MNLNGFLKQVEHSISIVIVISLDGSDHARIPINECMNNNTPSDESCQLVNVLIYIKEAISTYYAVHYGARENWDLLHDNTCV
jgi:hypothetical protein